MKVSMISLGCAKNQIDSEHMLSLADNAGYELCADISQSDAVIINTCGFIGEAREEAYENIREMILLKNEGTISRIIVTGCLVEKLREELAVMFPEIDALLGCGSYHEIAQALESDVKSFAPAEQAPLELGRVLTTPPHTAYIKIAEGCDNKCAYCVIPSLRGRYRSRRLEDIEQEAQALCEMGVKELIVIAQDTTRYGTDLYGARKLPELLRRLCTIDFEWIRLHYLYPDEIDSELIEVIATQPKIVKYIDLPIQHCNDRLLAAMNRRSTRADIERIFREIREKIPQAALRTSVIVGFPGETDAEFEELCEFLKQQKIPRTGVFTYSRERPGAAADMPCQIDEEVKNHRCELVYALQDRIMSEYSESRIGSVERVLCEGYDRYAEVYFGRSYAESPEVDGMIFFTSDKKTRAGEFADVKLVRLDDGELIGERV